MDQPDPVARAAIMMTLEQMITRSMMRMMAACVRFSGVRMATPDDDCDHPSPRMSIFQQEKATTLPQAVRSDIKTN